VVISSFLLIILALKYLVNKPVLEGRICRWLLIFQEFSFEVIIKPGKLNVGPDHLSRLESGESGRALDDQLPDADMFHIEAIPDYLSDIAVFLMTNTTPEGYSATQKRHLVVREVDYQLIVGQLYKLGLDSILRWCVLDHRTKYLMGVPQWSCKVDTLVVRLLHIRYYRLDYGGLQCSKTPQIFPGL
jgi:hypothetical protein